MNQSQHVFRSRALPRQSVRLATVLTVAITLFFAGFIPSAMAQTTAASGKQSRAGERGGGQMLERIRQVVSDLNLNDDQKTKVDAVLQAEQTAFRQAIQETRNASPDERRSAVRNEMEKLHHAIAAELTDDQKAKFTAKIQALRAEGGKGRKAATETPPTTEPTNADGAGKGGRAGERGSGERGGGQGVTRLREAVDKLDLTPEQKTKLEAIFKDLETKAADLRKVAKDSGGDRAALREKIRSLIEEAMTSLKTVLTPEQVDQLKQHFQAERGGRGAGKRGAGNDPSTQPANQKASADDNMMDGANNQKIATAAPTAVETKVVTLNIGDDAPQFTTKKIDGSTISLSNFQHKILLMLFGSYTSPSFRQRAVSFEALRHDFSSRANFLVIYTREAHPAGGWEVERNKDADIALPAATTLAERIKAATVTRDRLKIVAPIAVDSMDDAIATAYHASPNDAAVLINTDGKILAVQQWFEPSSMHDALAAAIQANDPMRN